MVFLVAVSLAACAWCYGGARTMQESFEFDLGVSLLALVPGAVAAALIVACAGMVAELRAKRPGPLARSVALAVIVPMLIASVISEAWILVDEARFRDEVEAAGPRPYSRARAWPNEIAALVYRPEYGITATD